MGDDDKCQTNPETRTNPVTHGRSLDPRAAAPMTVWTSSHRLPVEATPPTRGLKCMLGALDKPRSQTAELHAPSTPPAPRRRMRKCAASRQRFLCDDTSPMLLLRPVKAQPIP